MPVKITKKRVARKPGETGWFSEKQKMDALTLYLTLGNMYKVEEKLEIPVKTLYKWKYSQWWKDKIAELEAGNRIKLGTKVSNILSKASNSIEDRLDNGNFYWNRETKSIERRPLSTKDVIEILRVGVLAQEAISKAQDAYDQRDERDQRAEAQLKRLEEIAAKMGGKTTPSVIIDVEPIEVENAVESELRPRLQAGEQVQEHPGSDPQAGAS